MSKYSAEFKLKVVTEYLKGRSGSVVLAQKYHIPSSSLLRSWVRAYNAKGTSAFLKNAKQNQVYTRDFKENAVQLYLTSNLTYEEVCEQLKMPSIGPLFAWVKHFRLHGEISERQRGRARKIEASEFMVVTPSSDDDKQRIKELEKQLRYAKIEVEYLKGLRRLGNKVQLNKKQSSFTISEKNSNSKK